MRDRGKVRGDGDRRAGALPRLKVMIPGPRQSRSLKWEKIENSKTREHPTSQRKTLKVLEGVHMPALLPAEEHPSPHL